MVDRGIVAALLTVVTLTGLLFNSIAFYAVFRIKHLHNTFGVLCVVLALANVGDSLIHLAWCAFGPYLFAEQTLTGTRGKILALFLLDVKLFAHLGVSINRVFSLVSPLLYHTLESSVAVTSLFVLFPIIFATLQVSPLFWTEDCYMVYYKDTAMWGFDETPCNDVYSFYVDFVVPVVIYCVIVSLDGFAVLALRRAIKALSQYDESFKAKRRIEIGFFVQSVCQMVLSIVAYTSFCFVAYRVSSDWALFGSTTLAWALYHALDGIIMVAFKARRIFKRSQAIIFRAGTSNGQTAPTKSWIH